MKGHAPAGKRRALCHSMLSGAQCQVMGVYQAYSGVCRERRRVGMPGRPVSVVSAGPAQRGGPEQCVRRAGGRPGAVCQRGGCQARSSASEGQEEGPEQGASGAHPPLSRPRGGASTGRGPREEKRTTTSPRAGSRDTVAATPKAVTKGHWGARAWLGRYGFSLFTRLKVLGKGF